VTDFPCSLIEFQQRFPDEAACVDYLALGAPLLFKPQSLDARSLSRLRRQHVHSYLSMSSCSASTVAAPGTPPSVPCSASRQHTHPSATKC
jgi:hypothetical protein